MQYKTLGNTGITVSRICLGTMSYGGGDLPDWALGTKGWHVDKEGAREHFKIALDNGITFFDTADVYSAGLSEEITGFYLREMASRDDIVVATKVHGQMGKSPNKRGLSRKHIIEGCDNSLRRLGMDFIDLYQIHRWDPVTPVEETLDALDSLVRAGKVRYLGASSMAAWQLSKALYTAKENRWHRFSSMQNHYNLIYREEERETIPLCIDQGLAHHSLEPSGARISYRHAAARRRRYEAIRGRYVRQRHVLQPGRFRRRRRGCRGREATRRDTRADCARLGAAGARRDGSHCRRDEDEPAYGTDRRGRHQAHCRGSCGA